MPSGNFSYPGPALVILSGLPGSGKTTFAKALCAALGAEHIESDAIRRSLARSPSYTPGEHARVFAIAGRRAQTAVASGRCAVIDATNLVSGERRRFVRVAEAAGCPWLAVRLTAPEPVIRGRLAGLREGYSQAGIAVFEEMRARPRPFTVPVVVVDSRFAPGPSVALVIGQLEARAHAHNAPDD
jgi:uncharacterized protein